MRRRCRRPCSSIPTIMPLGEAMEEGWEGCLSVPGLRGVVPRHARIR